MMSRMSEPNRPDSIEEQRPASGERLPWSSPTLSDLGAVSEVTEGISYNPGDGLSNLST
jgi:hypothetical protein